MAKSRPRMSRNGKPRATRIVYVDPDRVPISYANNFYVNHNEHEFVITMAAVAPPPILHMTPEELESLDHVDATVTARIAMSPGRFKEFMSAVAENYVRWETAYGQRKQEKK